MGEARPQVPWRAKREGRPWLFASQGPAYVSLTTHTQPCHLAIHLPQQTLRGDQMDLF